MSIKRIVWTAFMAAAVACAPALWADPPARVGRINLIDGRVSFRPETVDEWVPARPQLPSDDRRRDLDG